ncbi:MAG TPA: lysophospholipid acyltransferase family protein [Candidatus Eisenbacteria bacterium]|nr:lysophospholipid acyltransferase family protein [Candidatus Eisenbacteria bacterium]
MSDLGYVIASFVARTLPRSWADRLADTLGDVYSWTHPNRSRAMTRRLRRLWTGDRATPPPTARETHRAFARAVVDFLISAPGSNATPKVRLDDEARQILHEVRASGRSTVLVSGHFGPWEVALQWLARELETPVDALARAHRSRRVERFFASRRAAFGVGTLSEGYPARTALRRLRAGGWIAALVDRGARAARCRVTSVGVGDAATPGSGETESGQDRGIVPVDRAPLLLARRASAQVLAGVSWRAPDGAVEIRFHPAFSLEPRRGGLGLQQAEALLQRFFDAHVRAHPTQWFDWAAGPPTAREGGDAARG